MLDAKYLVLAVTFSTLLLIPASGADASSNPNLFVSAENSQFENHFSGSMVIEVVIIDSDISDTGQGKGEPDVTINGKSLRMVQATDGNWYAYFANVERAKEADSTVGLAGQGLDFGVFCSRDTSASVPGISLSETDGFALPRSALGSTDGAASFTSCTGSPSGVNLNNVVRNAKSINTNSAIPSGQIGLDPGAWPLIQLYSFGDVVVQYNPGGSSQQVSLEYDEIPNISMRLDRELYPNSAEIFFTLSDFQLNQDPTDEDSWTFGAGHMPATFYQAYASSGVSSANGAAGLVDLTPHLSDLGFESNGRLLVDLGSVVQLQSNNEQPETSVSNGIDTFTEILTLVEDGPNSGIFDSADYNDQSTLGILDGAPRGQSGSVTYDDKSVSILTGSSSAAVSLNAAPNTTTTISVGDGMQPLKPGTKFRITLVDSDQNINSGSRDNLDVFRDTAMIPTLTLGSPVTLENARDVLFHTSSLTFPVGDSVISFVPNSNSDRLQIDTFGLASASYEALSVNLGISASSLMSVLLDTSQPNTDGTNWINYDLRSFENDLGISDFSNTSVSLHFGTLAGTSVTIVDAGDISSPKGFIQIDDSDVADISDESGTAFLVIDFGSSGTFSVSDGDNKQPIVFDIFSFGLQDSQDINNSIYRFELEETSDNSSTFEGTLEYSVSSKPNILDSSFIQTIRPIDDQVKFVVTDRLIDDQGISISYSDLDAAGVFALASTKSDIRTTAGIVSSDSQSYRFGQPVTITLNDPDLNLRNDLVDIYFVIDDSNSPGVDTVGKNDIPLLEILIKDIRYKRCTVDGVDYGGLGASGFTLVETGPSTGIFEGLFKMPSKICNESGTGLVSSAGGSLDAKYFDSRDDSGNSNVFTLLNNKPSSYSSSPQLSAYDVVKPLSGDVVEIILSGSLDNPRRGIPLAVTIVSPDGITQNFAATLTSAGSYKSVISVDEHTLSGVYQIQLSYNNSHVKTLSFVVSDTTIPDWVKNNAKWWSSGTVPDSEFISGIKYLIQEGLVTIFPGTSISVSEQEVPDWVKNNAKWWSDDQISDEDFAMSIQYLIEKGIIRI